MSLIVEDGSAMPNSESYVSVADCTTYHSNFGNAAWAQGNQAAQEAALRRATAYIDPWYRGRFPGYQSLGRGQALEWPRIGAYVVVPDDGRSDVFYYANRRDYSYMNGIYYILPNVIPKEIITATCEAALRELVSPGILTPDLSRDDLVRQLKVGPISLTYDSTSPTQTIFQKLDFILRSLLMPSSSVAGRASR